MHYQFRPTSIVIAAMLALSCLLSLSTITGTGGGGGVHAATVPVVYCHPSALSEAAPKENRQLCIALMERLDAAVREDMLDGLSPVKRQDVDHVFLRFGRRLGY